MARSRVSARRWWRVVQVIAGLTILVFVARRFWGDWDQIRAARIDWDIELLPLILSALLTLAMYALLILAWQLFLKDWGQRLSGYTAARIWVIANLGKYVPGKVWAIAGLAIMAQREGIAPWAATSSSIILQALAVGTGVVVVAVSGTELLAAHYPWIGSALWALAALSAVGVGLLTSSAVNRTVMRRFLQRQDLGSPRSRTVLFGILVNLVAWVAYGCAFWLLAQGTLPAVQLPLTTAIGAFTASYLAGLLAPFAPGGLFVREGVMLLMLQGSIGLVPAGALAVASRLMLTLTEVGLVVPFLLIPRETPRVEG